MTLETSYSYATNISSMGDLAVYLNAVTSGWFAYVIVSLTVMLGTFVGISGGGDFSKGLTVGSFMGFIFSIYFVRMGLMAAYIPGILIVTTIVGVLLIMGEK
jgi:hypothetical protein